MPAKGKYTLELVLKIEQYLALGMSHKKTCEAVGISTETFYQWIKKNPKVLLVCSKCRREGRWAQRNKPCNFPKCDGKIARKSDFSDTVKKARSLGQAKLLKTIHDASDDSWQAAAWMLERTNPEDFGRRQKIEIEDTAKTIKEIRDLLG
jgi:hypothetical protein